MINARIKIEQPYNAGKADDEVCTRMAEVTIFMPVYSRTNQIFGEGTSIQWVLSHIADVLVPIAVPASVKET